MELYVGLALAKENPQAARPMDPDLQQKYLVRLPAPHPVKLEVLSYSSNKLYTLASSIAASGMPVWDSGPCMSSISWTTRDQCCKSCAFADMHCFTSCCVMMAQTCQQQPGELPSHL